MTQEMSDDSRDQRSIAPWPTQSGIFAHAMDQGMSASAPERGGSEDSSHVGAICLALEPLVWWQSRTQPSEAAKGTDGRRVDPLQGYLAHKKMIRAP